MKKEYFLLNFCDMNFEHITKSLAIEISDFVQYKKLDGMNTIELFSILPYFWLSYKKDIIYFVEESTAIDHNKLWFYIRRKHNDLVIDLCGNCIKCNSLI